MIDCGIMTLVPHIRIPVKCKEYPGMWMFYNFANKRYFLGMPKGERMPLHILLLENVKYGRYTHLYPELVGAKVGLAIRWAKSKLAIKLAFHGAVYWCQRLWGD